MRHFFHIFREKISFGGQSNSYLKQLVWCGRQQGHADPDKILSGHGNGGGRTRRQVQIQQLRNLAVVQRTDVLVAGERRHGDGVGVHHGHVVRIAAVEDKLAA